MNRDGEIDYSAYSRKELQEAIQAVNRDKYPKNYAAAQSELANRSIPPIKAVLPINPQSIAVERAANSYESMVSPVLGRRISMLWAFSTVLTLFAAQFNSGTSLSLSYLTLVFSPLLFGGPWLLACAYIWFSPKPNTKQIPNNQLRLKCKTAWICQGLLASAILAAFPAIAGLQIAITAGSFMVGDEQSIPAKVGKINVVSSRRAVCKEEALVVVDDGSSETVCIRSSNRTELIGSQLLVGEVIELVVTTNPFGSYVLALRQNRGSD